MEGGVENKSSADPNSNSDVESPQAKKDKSSSKADSSSDNSQSGESETESSSNDADLSEDDLSEGKEQPRSLEWIDHQVQEKDPNTECDSVTISYCPLCSNFGVVLVGCCANGTTVSAVSFQGRECCVVRACKVSCLDDGA